MKKSIYLIVLIVFSVNTIAQNPNDSTYIYKERATSLSDSRYGINLEKYINWILSLPVNSIVIRDLYGNGINRINDKMPMLFPSDTVIYKNKFLKCQKQMIDSCLRYNNKNNIKIDNDILISIKENKNLYWIIDNANINSVASLEEIFWINLAKEYIRKDKLENEKYPIYTHGQGNKTFRITPQFLSTVFSTVPTLRTIESTLPEWSSHQDRYEFEDGMKSYSIDTYQYNVSVEYKNQTTKVEKIKISSLSFSEIKSFEQRLIAFGYILNPKLSDLANAINLGIGGWYEYYSKKGTKITFVLKSNQITVFK
jgi:hypothetical protein